MDGYQQKPRDRELIDALDALARIPFVGSVWRVVPSTRKPLSGHPSRGRWDSGTFNVIYTSLEPDGAIAEIEFRISNQPAFPSKISFVRHEIQVSAKSTLQLADMDELSKLGIDVPHFSEPDYQRSREIGDVAYFLDFDGLLVPNIRWPCNNLVLFTDRLAPDDLSVVQTVPVDFDAWRRRRKPRRA